MPTSILSRTRVAMLVLGVLLLADLGYSFWLHYHTPMDGDLAKVVLPSPEYRRVLNDPFAWGALVKGQYYVGPNRFIPHWTMERFFKLVPGILQRFMDPLTSVYASIAVAKTAIHVALLYLLSVYACGSFRITSKTFLLAACFLTPFFQSFGYNWHFGLVDDSVTYSFFYALASVWLLIFLLPLFFYFVHRRNVLSSRLSWTIAMPLAWATAFNGPLNPVVMLLICGSTLLWTLAAGFRNKGKVGHPTDVLPPALVLLLVSGVAFGLLSYAAGTFNIESQQQTLSLAGRYQKLPVGLAAWIADGPGPKILVGCIAFSLLAFMLRFHKSASLEMRLTVFFLLFAAIYILLLPLGGYREYRANIIRRDSIQPLIIGGLILFAMMSVHLTARPPVFLSVVYVLAFGIIATHLTREDTSHFGGTWCERLAITSIKNATRNPVLLDEQCNVMAWGKITDPNDTRHNVHLLHYWKALPHPKLYYQR